MMLRLLAFSALFFGVGALLAVLTAISAVLHRLEEVLHVRR